MADVATNRGARLFQELKFRGQWLDRNGAVRAKPTTFYYALCTASPAPTKDTNLLSELTQVSGGGYTSGGYAIPANAAGFPSIVEDDTLDKSVATIIDVIVQASGGAIPAFGWVALTDDAAVVSDRQVLGAFEVNPAVSIADGTVKVLQGGKLEDAPA